MSAPAKLPACISTEADMLLRASEVLDEFWHARYHGGTASGSQGHARWARLRAVANDIARWRRANGFPVTKARAGESALRKRRLAGGRK